MRLTRRCILLLIGGMLLTACAWAEPSVDGAKVVKMITGAKAGKTVTLPAGTFTISPITIPTGVKVRGVGYGKTILDAGNCPVGLTIAKGAKGIEVSDLTVRGAKQANIQITDAAQISVRSVCSQQSMTGVIVTRVAQAQLENLLVCKNQYGIVASGGQNNAVVNCTLAQNSSIGLSLPSGAGTVAFNNVITDSATGVYVGTAVRDLQLDNNLYFTLHVGKLGDQCARPKLGDWQYLSGYDAHSVQSQVMVRDQNTGDYHPTNVLDWAPTRAITAEWGVSALAGVKAPATDIDGNKRSGDIDLGVYEMPLTPPRSPDGTLRVTTDAGIKSAGIFTKDGRLVAYLFHNLPLRKGSYPFWLPARSSEGKVIAAGDYEVRLVESNLRWEYLGWLGDNAPIGEAPSMATCSPNKVAFDGRGHVLVGSAWSEDGCFHRAYDIASGRCVWYLPGRDDPDGNPQGLTVDAQGQLYMLRAAAKPQGQILRLDPMTGKVLPGWGSNDAGQIYYSGGYNIKGMTELDGKLFFADPAANTIHYGPTAKPIPYAGSFSVPSPTWVTADRKTNLLWCISEGKKLVAMKPDGTVVVEATPTPDIAAMAVCNGTLAVASRRTGKIHLFDATDPKQLRPTRTLGRGDGPYGYYLPDRFTFQNNEKVTNVDIAIGPDGDVAVIDHLRVICFDANGVCRWFTFSLGNLAHPSHVDPQRQYVGNLTLRLDEKTNSWKPEGFWNLTLPEPGGWKTIGDFMHQGKTILVFAGWGVGPDRVNAVQFWEFTDKPWKPLVEWLPAKGQIVYRRDTNGNGRFDADDKTTTGAPPKGGMPFTDISPRFSRVMPNGDFYVTWSTSGNSVWQTCWKFGGLDAQGIPIYRFEDRVEIPRPKDAFISPHSHAVDNQAGFNLVAPQADGGMIGNFWAKSSPYGTGWSNTAGTDLARVDAKGNVRWFHNLGAYGGTPGIAQLGPVTILGVCANPQILAFNEDGLGLGSCGIPAQVNWEGFWIDYEEALQGYMGADGQPYAVIGDNVKGCGHWYRLHGHDQLISTKTPIHVSEATATVLQAVKVDPPKKISTRPPTPTLRIPRLAQPLPIDGDLVKWRKAGITPQIIMSPETGLGVKGPKDCSAVIRVAYEGKNLYFQILQFDDLVSFHQPSWKSYLQDNVEITLNSFPEGFKFMCSPTVDKGVNIPRQNGWRGIPEWHVPADLAPRVVKVLDSARDVTERAMIENIFGEDMRDCKVIVTEIKLPITEATYQGYKEALFPLEPGKNFWLGFMLDDNDGPGTDVQQFLLWPATHGTFNLKEDSALAVFD